MNVIEPPQKIDCVPVDLNELKIYPTLVKNLNDLKIYGRRIYYDSFKNVYMENFKALSSHCTFKRFIGDDFFNSVSYNEKQRIHTILDDPKLYKASDDQNHICPLVVFTATENGDDAQRYMIPLFELCSIVGAKWEERPFEKLLSSFRKNRKIGLVCFCSRLDSDEPLKTYRLIRFAD